jgi:hypothetical protein
VPKIEFIRQDERVFTPALVGVPESRLASMTDVELAEAEHIATFTRHAGGPDQPHLFEVRFDANTLASPHAHGVDEIIVVVEGEIHFGNKVFAVGSSISIPKDTLYSFRAGPEGVTFLNFRSVRDGGVFNREQLLARRAAAAQAPVPAHVPTAQPSG